MGGLDKKVKLFLSKFVLNSLRCGSSLSITIIGFETALIS